MNKGGLIKNEYLGLENQELWIINNQQEVTGLTRRTSNEKLKGKPKE